MSTGVSSPVDYGGAARAYAKATHVGEGYLEASVYSETYLRIFAKYYIPSSG